MGKNGGVSPEADRRQTARLAIVAVAALACAMLAPPVGAAIGVVALVLVVRSKDAVSTRARVLTAVAGLLAVVLGLTITTVAVVFRAEITDYSRCLSAANTVQARDNCEADFADAVGSRLGL